MEPGPDLQHWLRHYLFEDLLLLWCELHLLLNLGPQLGWEEPPALHPPLKLNRQKPEIKTSSSQSSVCN
jgi:hypothetical protein